MGRTIKETILREVAGDAEDAFWSYVARRYPDIKTGDIDPDSEIKFRRACREAIEAWLDQNTPLIEWEVQYVYLDVKPNEVYRAVGYLRAATDAEAREIVNKGCARPIRIVSVKALTEQPPEPTPLKRWRVDIVGDAGGGGEFRHTRWVDGAASAAEAEEIVRKGTAGTIKRIDKVTEDGPALSPPWQRELDAVKTHIEADEPQYQAYERAARERGEQPLGRVAWRASLVDVMKKMFGSDDFAAAHEHDKGPGHTETLNEDWGAFVALLPAHNGWQATWECAGAGNFFLRWNHPPLQLEVVATPDWESGDSEEIVFDLRDNAGERLKAFGPPEWFERTWEAGGIEPWPKAERTVASYMALVGPKLDGVLSVVSEYRNAAIRALQDAGWEGTGDDGDIAIDDVPNLCPIAEELPGAWIVVSVFIDQRDLTGETVTLPEVK